jgi:DNA-binding NarL/FixJ family response regulator
VTRRVIAEFARRRPVYSTNADAAHQLTARETDIVRLLAQGTSNAEIAKELVIETSTVNPFEWTALGLFAIMSRTDRTLCATQRPAS